MQLKKIKLAGFKSFVDPTIVPVPSKLVAVVGPNGCGKSNIIDAVCWVMGENSAKNLRGESLADVIFNGSGARKPVGQASVELIFDNQDGAIGGEYASYAEISIRRVITRDGDSSYYLNGSRCRRRDIIDIFLGTGLGPRSYSIIGQNMISRIIEAKPDDMRIYLEEAAGVSKYKERRRETENRIAHTKENLARLNDVRLELEKQLATLQRQANAAEKFKILKQEERMLRSQALAAQWRQIDARLVQHSLQIQQEETRLEARLAELVNLKLSADEQQESRRLAGEAFQEVQRRYYDAGNSIARLEQDIRYTEERQQQLQADMEQTDKAWSADHARLEEIKVELKNLAETCEGLEPESEKAQKVVIHQVNELEKNEEAMQDWQTQWDEFNQELAKLTQTAQVEKNRIVHLEQRLEMIKQRQEKIGQEESQLNFAELETELANLAGELNTLIALSADHNKQVTETREEMTALRQTEQQTVQQLDKTRSLLQQLRGKQASLEALQQTALGQRDNQVAQWLNKYNLDKVPRLAQQVEVESGWELAVEKVLGARLQAICVESLTDVADVIAKLENGSLCAVAAASDNIPSPAESLALLSKVKSKWPLHTLLSGIYIAENQEEALKISATLASHESVITRDGVWLSANWLAVSREKNPAAGVFQREQELKQLAKQIQENAELQTNLEATLAAAREKLKMLEKQLNDAQKSASQTQAKIAEMQARQKMKQERLQELTVRAERYRKEKDEMLVQAKQIQADLLTAHAVCEKAESKLAQQAEERDQLIQQRDRLREELHEKRDLTEEAKEAAHQMQLQLQTAKSRQQILQQTIERMQSQLTALAGRKTVLQNDIQNIKSLIDLKNELNQALNLRLQVESELNQARLNIEAIEQELKSLDDQRQILERDSAAIRDTLEKLRLDNQGLKVKSETVIEKIARN